MKPRSCREKGRRFEFWTRKVIASLLNIPLEEVLIRSKSAPGTDVWVSPSFRELFPFGVECKNKNRISFWKTVKQAEENAIKDGLIPMIWMKNKKVWVALPLEVFFVIFLNKKLTEEEFERIKEEMPLFSEATFSEENSRKRKKKRRAV